LTGGGASSYSWTGGVTNGIGFVPTSTNTYTVTGTDVNSCTNTTAVTVGVNPLPGVTTTLNGIVITANQSGAAYQWLNCNTGNSPITSATNQSYTAAVNGNYAVLVTLNGCSDTSACVNVSAVGIAETPNNNLVLIYPNPAYVFLIVSCNIQNTEHVKIKLVNSIGEITLEDYCSIQPEGDFSARMDVSKLPSGLYSLLVLFGDDKIITKKAIILK
jgi:hypothetical protein